LINLDLENMLSKLDSFSDKKDFENPLTKTNYNSRDDLLENVRSDEYKIMLLDNSWSKRYAKIPYVLTPEIANVTKRATSNCTEKLEKARGIYDWICKNINYGSRKRRSKGYRNSIETFDDGEGVCGEMAFLYITMARYVGLRSSYAIVDIDHNNSRVNHACAAIDVPSRNSKITLVDPAYKVFDANHREIIILEDFDMFKIIKDWE
jgi:hypothetical protein